MRRPDLRTLAVWGARAVAGATFIISGWAKAVDPAGFILKVGEYLSAWGYAFPREVILAFCVILAGLEFLTGILLAVGSLKRTAASFGLAMMAGMLPLTLYIALVNPVSDCGCFGDFWVISNWSTFAKNIVLTLLLVYLLKNGRATRGFYPDPIQWLVVVVSLLFAISLEIIGYRVQPVVDFRPYRVGTALFGRADAPDAEMRYIYEKDGRQEIFGLDALPDSTWVYVDAIEEFDTSADGGFQALDADGEDVSDELADTSGPRLYIVVTAPDVQFLSRSHFVNELASYAHDRGIDVAGLVAGTPSSVGGWVELTRPSFPVYSAEDTALKQLVRGDAALVYTSGDTILWKYNIQAIPDEILSGDADTDNLAAVLPVDDGRLHTWMVILYLAAMLVIYLAGLSPKILYFFIRHNKKMRNFAVSNTQNTK